MKPFAWRSITRWRIAAVAVLLSAVLAYYVLAPIVRQAKAVDELEGRGLFYEVLAEDTNAHRISLNVQGIIHARLIKGTVGYVITNTSVDDSMIDAIEHLPLPCTLGFIDCRFEKHSVYARLNGLSDRIALKRPPIDLMRCVLPDGEMVKHIAIP